MNEGRQMVEGFHYVQEVFRNVSRLLLSADALLSDRKHLPYPTDWSASYPKKIFKVDEPQAWLPYYFIRQYHPVPQEPTRKEILTVGVVLWNPQDPDFNTPLCIGSRMVVRETSDDVYWLALAQLWSRDALPDGQVRRIDRSSLGGPGWDTSDTKRFEELMVEGALLSIAVPLLGITRADELEDRVLAPLFLAPWPLAPAG